MSASSATHDELVEIAARWLRNTRGCGVVLTELSTGLSEVPDAIGWRAGHWSILVECKTSRADFRADQDKPGRRQMQNEETLDLDAGWLTGVGQERVYLAPRGLLHADEMPDGWGLIEWNGRQVRYAKKVEGIAANRDRQANEVYLLVSALRRHAEGTLSAAILNVRALQKKDLAVVERTVARRMRALCGLPEDIEAADDGVERAGDSQ